MNISQKTDPRMWDKWRASGSLGTMVHADLRTARNYLRAKPTMLMAIRNSEDGTNAYHFPVSVEVLHIGVHRFIGNGQTTVRPEVILYVPTGHCLREGDILSDIPKGAQSPRLYWPSGTTVQSRVSPRTECPWPFTAQEFERWRTYVASNRR